MAKSWNWSAGIMPTMTTARMSGLWNKKHLSAGLAQSWTYATLRKTGHNIPPLFGTHVFREFIRRARIIFSHFVKDAEVFLPQRSRQFFSAPWTKLHFQKRTATVADRHPVFPEFRNENDAFFYFDHSLHIAAAVFHISSFAFPPCRLKSATRRDWFASSGQKTILLTTALAPFGWTTFSEKSV